MMSNNKILTVSYGTFSCTLEGFDDSFGTMKAIAEYFRDLASDDRYFGAEPPVPDAEMLARIAEKEISRRVEAREHQGRIVLSASDPALASAMSYSDAIATPAPSEADVAADAAKQEMAAQIAKDEAARAETARAEAAAEAARVEAEAEARAAEAEAAAEAALAKEAAERAQAEAEAQAAADAKAAAEAQAAADALAQVAAGEAEQTTARDLAAELPEAEAFFARSTSADADEDSFEDIEDISDAPAPRAATIVPHAESIAAKLERIRQVVSQADTSADDEDDYSEDEHAENVNDDDMDDVLDAIAHAEVDVDAPERDGSNNASNAEAVMGDALADIEAALAADDAATEADEDQAMAADQNNDDEDDISSILAGLEGNFDDNGLNDDNLMDDQADAAQADADDDMALDADENIFDAESDETSAEAEEAVQPRRLARVIKVKRADLENAIAQGDLEEVEEDFGPSSLSQEEEDELLRELAEVEAEAGDAYADIRDPAPAEPAALAADSDPDEDVGRLMAQTDAQMDEAESAQNREAFAHLRAAVAARNADGELVSGDDGTEETAYRTDLAEAVKPRRPVVTGEGRSARPDVTPRPAPLKLVAEQRVDMPEADLRGPVRPRRVASVPQPDTGEAGSFADYAADLGAVKLPDLLEAAASYMSFIEGRDQFSRPQLMNKVRQVEQEDFSREDGLRSFGQLLRAGKIEKIKGGRFAVTGDIGYRPDARAAG